MRKNKYDHLDIMKEQGIEVATAYGDVVTFALAIFIMLFTVTYNQVKNQKFSSAIKHFEIPAQEHGVGNTVSTEPLTASETKFVKEINHFIQQENFKKEINIQTDEERIKLIINPPVLFDSGKSKIEKRGLKLISSLGDFLKQINNKIIIEGYTDNKPINNTEFSSNWELSFYRAYSVLNYLVREKKIPEDRLSLAGYGEFHPLAPNDSNLNRAKNRRIEINIIRNK